VTPLTPLFFALFAAAPAPPPAAGPTFEVAGSVSLTGDDELEVRVDLTNRGGTATGPVAVTGELAGHYDEAKLAAGVRPGETLPARLVFPREVPRPGVYPMVLLLDYSPRGPAGGTPAAVSQRAFLLLTLGAAAPSAVRISAPEVRLRDRALLPVTLESADGQAHRVRMRVLTARGLNPERARDEVAVPASGPVTVVVPLLRGSAPRPSRQGVLMVAETVDGDVVQSSTATTVVAVEAASDLLPRLRVPVAVTGGLLLAVAAVLEWRHLRQARRAAVDPAA
jgi:hypothetical protein